MWNKNSLVTQWREVAIESMQEVAIESEYKRSQSGLCVYVKMGVIYNLLYGIQMHLGTVITC